MWQGDPLGPDFFAAGFAKHIERIWHELNLLKPGAFELDLQLDDLHLRGPLALMSEADGVVSGALSDFNIIVVAEKGQLFAPDIRAEPPAGRDVDE